MITKFIEATDATQFNHGKFLVGRFTQDEWRYGSVVFAQWNAEESQIHPALLTSVCGWDAQHLLVFDLQTGEGGLFQANPTGCPSADLQKHHIWVCPMFAPFLGWVYHQDARDLSKWPAYVDLGNVQTALYGYRRPGVESVTFGTEMYELVEVGPNYTIIKRGGQTGIRCTTCQRISWNGRDAENLYCGGCHKFHTPGPTSRWARQT